MSKELIKKIVEEDLVLANEEFSDQMNRIVESKLHEYKKAISARVIGVLDESAPKPVKAPKLKNGSKRTLNPDLPPSQGERISWGMAAAKAKKANDESGATAASIENNANRELKARTQKRVNAEFTAAVKKKKAEKDTATAEKVAKFTASVRRGEELWNKRLASKKETETQINQAKQAVADDNKAALEKNKRLSALDAEGLKNMAAASTRLAKSTNPDDKPRAVTPFGQEKKSDEPKKPGLIKSLIKRTLGKFMSEEEMNELHKKAISATIQRLMEAKKITLADLRNMPAMTPKEREEANIGRYKQWDKIKADAEKDREEARKAAKKKD